MSNMQIVEHNESIMKVQRANATWLGVIDIFESAPVTLTIDAVVMAKNATFDKGRKEDKQAVRFKETSKLLPLNATNSKQLYKIGKNNDELKGKQLQLDVYRLDREFNGHTHGIKIIPVKGK